MAGRETTSLLVLILIALPVLVFAIQTLRTEPSRKGDREYKEGDYIPLFSNTAFPNQNPCEAYSYFDLPFCPPRDPIPNRMKSFEEVIVGDCYMNTGYELRFKKETKKKLLCEKNLKREEVAKFRDAIAADTAYLVPVILTGLVVTILAITIGEVLDSPEYDDIAYYIIIYLFIGISFLTVGGIFRRTSLNESEITCSTRHFQNEITNQAWYMRTPTQMFLGGLLPFSLIFSMMDDIYASLYNLKVCGAFSTMFTAFISIIALTLFVGIICTCSQLYKQDHQWWWRSVLRGGSVAIFMFAHGLYFYARANARISMKLIGFPGYNACIFYAVFLMLGTIGFYASSIGFHYMGRVLRRR